MSSIISNTLINKKDVWQHFLATAAAVISRSSLFLIVLINTQFLDPSEFGVFTLLLLTANIVTAFVSCGGDMWLNRFTRRRHTHQLRAPIVSGFYFKMSLTLAGIVTLTSLGIIAFGQKWLGGYEIAIGFSLLWAATTGIIETILAILRTTNQIHRFFIIRDFFMPLILIGSILCFKFNTCSEFFVMAFILWMGTLIYLLQYIFKRKSLFQPNAYLGQKILRKDLLIYTFGLILNNFSARFVSSLDTLILVRFFSMDFIGKYRLVTHFSNAFIVVQHFVFLALPYHLRKSLDTLTHSENFNSIKFRQLLLICSAVPALFILIFFSKFILKFLAPGFQTMAPFLAAFLIIRFSELLWGPQHEELISNNKVMRDTLANGFGILFNIVVFLGSLHYFNAAIAATVAAGLSSVLIQLIRYFSLKQHRHADMILAKPWFHLPWTPIILVLMSIIYVTHYTSIE